MVDQALVGRGVQFQPLQHFELGFRIGRRAFLIGALWAERVASRSARNVWNLTASAPLALAASTNCKARFKRSVVIYPRLGNDEYVCDM